MSDLQELFDSFEPKYSKQNLYMVEKNMVENTKKATIHKWNDIIIFNKHLINICEKHNLNYKIIEKIFDSKTEALKWKMNSIIETNLSRYQKATAALKFADIMSLKKYELEQQYHISKNDIEKIQYINNHATEEQIEIMQNGGITCNKLFIELKKINKGIQAEIPETIYKEFTDERKRCSKCNQVKKINEFYKNKNSCKECDEKRKKNSLAKDIKGNIIEINDSVSFLKEKYEEKIEHDLYDTEKEIIYTFSDMKEEVNEIINYLVRNLTSCFENHKNLIEDNKYDIYTILCNINDEIDKIRRSFL